VSHAPSYAVVVPTVGRSSLAATLLALGSAAGPLPSEVVVVDDRPDRSRSLPVPAGLGPLQGLVQVVAGRAAGPAAARNVGWRATSAEWVAFLDDDVVPAGDWRAALGRDLAAAEPAVGGVQGRLRVPLPADRRPTDWERCTAGLADTRWATADMAYRRAALTAVGGFDERFRRAFREDTDLALRVRRAGYALAVGTRECEHPVRTESRWISVRTQRGNADDALMRRLHGPTWREDGEAPPGRLRRHVAVTIAAATAIASVTVGAVAPRRLHRAAKVVGTAAGLVAVAGTTEFATARIAPGPRAPAEGATMLVTSALIPPVACAHAVKGRLVHRRARPWPVPSP